MEYKLAKRLNNAGFPVPENYDDKSYGIYIPSLEELIKACGKHLLSLNQYEESWGCHLDIVYPSSVGEKTPIETVTMGWLALNEKHI